ncbi:hypothetical protein AB0F25_31655 [Streptomyces wedmorensis]|uniref:hypothetical protein n=1 Tax=Streptomyces wedmorensis TaxID=43759 RepID=UPI0034135EE8
MVAWILAAVMPLGVVAIVMGVAAFRTGWMIAPARRGVRRPRVYGVGAVLAGVGLLIMGTTYFVLSGDEAAVLWSHPWLAVVGNSFELAGIAFIAASRRAPRHAPAAHPVA